jgi:hypothetical protein
MPARLDRSSLRAFYREDRQMAGKSKKHRTTNPVSLGAEGKPQMVSQKVKKQKKTSRGK